MNLMPTAPDYLDSFMHLKKDDHWFFLFSAFKEALDEKIAFSALVHF